MKTKQNLCIICMMLLISSCKNCKQCKTYTQYETAPVILEYFGNYKPGNYWIYENQDGTKRDSMWVSDYVESKGGGSAEDCFRFPVREFILHSEYLGKNGTNLETSISNGGGNRSEYMVSYIRCLDPLVAYNSKEIFGASAKIQSDELDNCIIILNYKPTSSSILVFSKVLIPKNSDPFPLRVFADSIGIVAFSSANLSDTFSLINCLLK